MIPSARMNRQADEEESFYVEDSDEEEANLMGKSRFVTPMKSLAVIVDSDSEEDLRSSSTDKEFQSASSNGLDADSGSVDSEQEDMEFMNSSHRVSIQISSESEGDESSPEIKRRNLKRRSIYDNPINPSTPGSELTPINVELKKRTRRVIRIIDSDSEDVSVNKSRSFTNKHEPIAVSDEEVVKSSDPVVEQMEFKSRKTVDSEADETHFDEDELDVEKSNEKLETSFHNSNRNSAKKKILINERSYSSSYSDSAKRKSLNFKNLIRKSNIEIKGEGNHNFTDLLDESSDSSVNNARSRTSSISSNVSTRKSLFHDDKIVDLTINKHEFPGKNEKNNDDEIVISSASTSESEMDQNVLAFAKKEIGVGNINPIEAQKKELLTLQIKDLQAKLNKFNKFTESVDFKKLPDRGEKVFDEIDEIEKKLKPLKAQLEKLQRKTVSKTTELTPKIKEEPRAIPSFQYSESSDDEKKNTDINNPKMPKLEYANQFDDFDIHNIPNVPKTNFDTRDFGKQAMETLNKQQSLTNQRLEQLHGSLTSRPAEDQTHEDPKGLKVPLMHHQKHALAWMVWRENAKPKGGILADDMGLGKTLTMISLTLLTVDNDSTEDSDSSSQDSSSDDEWYPRNSRKRYYGGTLVVCPASLINQWEGEVKKRVKKGLLSVLVFHGNNRQINDQKLSKYNIVITTYQTLVREQEKETGFYKMEWNRVILDEAHVIRNHKSKASIAACGLSAKRRWALTGTPIQNKEADLYAILKFLKCSPFDDLKVWKRWVENKNDAGKQRLITLMNSLMLRRTKQELQNKGSLEALPEKFFETIEIELDREEKLVYQKILLFSQNLFAQFLTQRAEKNHMRELYGGKFDKMSAIGTTTQFTKAQKLLLEHHSTTYKEHIESHEILVLLLRLRQMCCHPALIHKMLEKVDAELNGIDEHGEHLTEDMLRQLQNMSVKEDEEVDEHAANYKFDTEVAKNLLTKNNPVFDDDRRSSKVRAILQTIEDVLKKRDKIIVVSQWTEFLKIVARNLVDIDDARYEMFTGEVAIKNRQAIVDEFNHPRSEVNILFLSLTAGGVGLNLVGANHLLLIDLHWNPQLEAQAQDRIYRFGQKKNVHIYKFLCKDTIEERIKLLQQKKIDCADYVLTGTRSISSKLSLDDLKLLFS